jgi:hypothetical protein
MPLEKAVVDEFEIALRVDDASLLMGVLDRALDEAYCEIVGNISAQATPAADAVHKALLDDRFFVLINEVRDGLTSILTHDRLSWFDSLVDYWRGANFQKIMSVLGRGKGADHAVDFLMSHKPYEFFLVLDEALSQAECIQDKVPYNSTGKLASDFARAIYGGSFRKYITHILGVLRKYADDDGPLSGRFRDLTEEFRLSLNVWVQKNRDRLTVFKK